VWIEPLSTKIEVRVEEEGEGGGKRGLVLDHHTPKLKKLIML